MRGIPPMAKKAWQIELAHFLLDVLRESKTKFPRVPLKTGALQSTGSITPPVIVKNFVLGGLHYGGFSNEFDTKVDYAEEVHENLAKKVFKRPRAGAKFVATHWNKRKKVLKTNLIGILDRVNRGGFRG